MRRIPAVRTTGRILWPERSTAIPSRFAAPRSVVSSRSAPRTFRDISQEPPGEPMSVTPIQPRALTDLERGVIVKLLATGGQARMTICVKFRMRGSSRPGVSVRPASMWWFRPTWWPHRIRRMGSSPAERSPIAEGSRSARSFCGSSMAGSAESSTPGTPTSARRRCPSRRRSRSCKAPPTQRSWGRPYIRIAAGPRLGAPVHDRIRGGGMPTD